MFNIYLKNLINLIFYKKIESRFGYRTDGVFWIEISKL